MQNWTHSDPQGLQVQFEAALQRSTDHGWAHGTLEQRGAELRALTMGTALTAWRAFDSRPFETEKVIIPDFPDVEKWPSVQHRQAASRLLDTLVLLADGHAPTNQNFVTVGGVPGLNTNTEGWPIVVAAIAASAIWAVASCYIAERYEPTLNGFLSRKDAGDKLLAAQADAVKVVNNHANMEVQVGKPIPYTDQENAVLDALLKTQETFANKKDPPRPNLPHIGDGATSLGIGAMVAIGIVGYLAFKENS